MDPKDINPNNPFEGMTDEESVGYQVFMWVQGNSLHNPIRDECCPDFSCCDPKGQWDEPMRKSSLRRGRLATKSRQRTC